MANYFSHYCTLISSAEQLDYCCKAQSLKELLDCIKTLWGCDQYSDDELLSEISRLNQTPITTCDIQLSGKWLPYRYQAKHGLVNWLLPVGHATEPFFDEYISRCRQQLLNQIIQPCTSLAVACEQSNNQENIQPAGFIFHLSRCGSTLISGCLSELESTCVFSESPLLTELLLDNQLSVEEQKESLRAFINLQAAAFADRPQMIVKWNAWDIFRWDLIRDIYPEVPVIFLVRDPVEILASHERASGRHMVGDSALQKFHPLFANWADTYSVLNKRIHILDGLLNAMGRHTADSNVRVIDYQQLNDKQLIDVVVFLGGYIDEESGLKIQTRKNYHSKQPAQIFVIDNAKKQNHFVREEQVMIMEKLMPAYKQLVDFTHNS